VPDSLWRSLNWQAVVFYAALGALNLAVAFHASERVWVSFKAFGLTLATMIFVALQLLWLSRRLASAGESAAAS
jgi:intracellular septation protein